MCEKKEQNISGFCCSTKHTQYTIVLLYKITLTTCQALHTPKGIKSLAFIRGLSHSNNKLCKVTNSYTIRVVAIIQIILHGLPCSKESQAPLVYR